MTKRSYIFLLVMMSVFGFGASAVAVDVEPPELQVKIGDFGSQSDFALDYGNEPCNTSQSGQCLSVPWIGQYVGALYRYGIGFAAVLSVVMSMVGGAMWLTSGGSPDRVSTAKSFITSSLVGLLLALFSFTILYTVNPALVSLESLSVPSVQNITVENPNTNTTKSKATSDPGCCVTTLAGTGGVGTTCVQSLNLSSCEGSSASYGGGSSRVAHPNVSCDTIAACGSNIRVEQTPEVQSGCCVMITTDRYGFPGDINCEERSDLSGCRGTTGSASSFIRMRAEPGRSCAEVSQCR